MNKTYKSFIAVLVVLAFLATAVLCCCMIKEGLAGAQKAACSHCSTKTKSDAGKHECCFSKASPMEMVKHSGILPLLPLLILTVFAFRHILPRLPLVLNSLYLNGPPGPYTLVPIYIKSRSIRI